MAKGKTFLLLYSLLGDGKKGDSKMEGVGGTFGAFGATKSPLIITFLGT